MGTAQHGPFDMHAASDNNFPLNDSVIAWSGCTYWALANVVVGLT